MPTKYSNNLFLYFIDMTEQKDWKAETSFYFSSPRKKAKLWSWTLMKSELMQHFKVFFIDVLFDLLLFAFSPFHVQYYAQYADQQSLDSWNP